MIQNHTLYLINEKIVQIILSCLMMEPYTAKRRWSPLDRRMDAAWAPKAQRERPSALAQVVVASLYGRVLIHDWRRWSHGAHG